MGNPVVHFEIIGKDTARLGDFYSRLFGWSVDTNNPMGYGMVSTGVEGSLAGRIGQSADASFVTSLRGCRRSPGRARRGGAPSWTTRHAG